MKQVPDFLPLEAANLLHFLAEFHSQTMHLEVRPVVIEQDLRRHRLPVPGRGCLSHQEDVRFLGGHVGKIQDFEKQETRLRAEEECLKV
jgi:hypothetical protein